MHLNNTLFWTPYITALSKKIAQKSKISPQMSILNVFYKNFVIISCSVCENLEYQNNRIWPKRETQDNRFFRQNCMRNLLLISTEARNRLEITFVLNSQLLETFAILYFGKLLFSKFATTAFALWHKEFRIWITRSSLKYFQS